MTSTRALFATLACLALASFCGCSGRETDQRVEPADDPTSPPPSTGPCTLVIGYSQAEQWYEAGGVFESLVGDDAWELLWKGGGGVDRWQDPGYAGWSSRLRSPCTSNARSPDRILLSVSGPFGADEVAWAAAIAATVDTIRQKYPSVGQVVLEPVVGGPVHQDCFVEGERVRASWQHAHIDAAIATLVDGVGVVAGLSPEVRSCADYRDALGHLTDDGALAAAQSLGSYYAGSPPAVAPERTARADLIETRASLSR